MRKLVFTAALILISVSAQAGQSRGLIVASNEAPRSSIAEQLKALGPETPAMQTADAKIETKGSGDVAAKAETRIEAKPEAKPETRTQPKPVTKKRETDEQKARRIAARYGISW